MPNCVKVFRFNLFSWGAGYDLASVKSAYLVETGVAWKEVSDQEELSQEAMNTVRIYTNPYAKESSTFQGELTRMVDEGQEFPCYFAGRYTPGGSPSHSAVMTEDRT